MLDQPATLRDSLGSGSGGEADVAVPGVLLIFSTGRPTCVALPLEKDTLVLGRGDGSSAMPIDPKLSRRHATVSYDGARFQIADHGSQNGTHVDGQPVDKTL